MNKINLNKTNIPKKIISAVACFFTLLLLSFFSPSDRNIFSLENDKIIFHQESTAYETFEKALTELKNIYHKYNEIGQNINTTREQKRKNSNNLKKRAKSLFDSLISTSFTGKLSLDKYWQRLKKKEKINFINNFKTIIENKFSTKPKDNKNSYQKKKQKKSNKIEKIKIIKNDLFFDKIFLKKKVARIQTMLPGDEIEINVDFLMIYIEKRFIIYDIYLDGDSIVNGYKNQFHRIIRKQGLKGLLKKLKRKAEQIRKKNSEKK